MALKVKAPKAKIGLLPMLIKPNPGITTKEFKDLLAKQQIEVTSVYKNIVFGQVPLASIAELVKIAKLQHIEKSKPPSFGGHELLIARTLLLEKTLTSLAGKEKSLKVRLVSLAEDSQDNREDFKHNIGHAHVILKRDHDEILADSFRLVGKKELIKQMTALARKEITANSKNTLYAARMTRVIEDLKKRN